MSVVVDRNLAARMTAIEPFHVMALLARAHELQAQGRDIVHMEIGEPDFASADPIIEAGIAALRDGQTHYTPATGIPALREAVAAWYRRRYDVEVDPGRIVITSGASAALFMALAAIVGKGDDVLMTDPGYPCNRHLVSLLDATPVSVPVGADTNYQLLQPSLAACWSSAARAVMLASPSNPTGTTMTSAEVGAVLDHCRTNGADLIVDEIYQGLIYDGDGHTALALGDDVIVINSFSKYFQMTGWRLGWLVIPQALVDAVQRLAQNVYLCPPGPAQYAALAALSSQTEGLLEQRKQQFAERRDYLLPALREIGFSIPVTPAGAFYIYADCSAFGEDSFSFAHRLLEEEGVAITPGIDFGVNAPERHVRFAYTTGIDRLAEALTRIHRFTGR